ncbi:DNA-3-methyladenine glycosylase family protein [Paralcaligenes ginsengisoli]
MDLDHNASSRGCPRRQPSRLANAAGSAVAQEAPAGPPGEIDIFLPYRPPYDWASMLEFLRRRTITGIETVSADCYARTMQLDGGQGMVAVRAADGNALRATVRFSKPSVLPVIVERLSRVFDLTVDPSVIAAHLAKDRVLAPLVKARPGLRVPGAWDGFELSMRAVLGQQITVAAAVRLAGRMVAAHGEHLARPDGDLTHVFPKPETIAATDLASLGMPRSRAATLSAVAAAAIADTHLFDTTGGLDEAVKRLRKIRGVGEWTAQYIALRQLHEPDAFPSADIGLMRAMARLEGRDYSSSELLARADAWRPWRAYAAQHLWTSG